MAEAWVWGVATFAALLVWRRVLKLAVGRSDGAPNPASRLLDATEVLGVLLIASAEARALEGLEDGPRALWTAVFGGVATAAVVVVARIVNRVCLRAHVGPQIAEGNLAAALAAGGQVLAAAIVAADCFGGDGWADLGISLVAFLCASLALHGLVSLFRALTTYDDAAEILGGNVAAALSYAGVCVALGLVVGNAIHGEWLGFAVSGKAFGAALLWALALYPVRQLLVSCLILGAAPALRGGPVDAGVAARDVGYAAIEAASYLGVALLARSLA